MVLKEGLDRAAQQSRIVTAEGGNNEDGGVEFAVAGAAHVAHVAVELDQLTPRALPDGGRADPHRHAVHFDLVDMPVRLAVPAGHVAEQLGAGC